MIRSAHSCECEHSSHFPNDESKLAGHSYGCEFHSKHLKLVRLIQGKRIDFGTYKLCPACHEGCAGPLLKGGNES